MDESCWVEVSLVPLAIIYSPAWLLSMMERTSSKDTNDGDYSSYHLVRLRYDLRCFRLHFIFNTTTRLILYVLSFFIIIFSFLPSIDVRYSEWFFKSRCHLIREKNFTGYNRVMIFLYLLLYQTPAPTPMFLWFRFMYVLSNEHMHLLVIHDTW